VLAIASLLNLFSNNAGSVEFSIRANHAVREAVALVSLESSPVLELAIQLPAAWPLQDAKLDCRKGVRPFPCLFTQRRKTFA